MAEIRWVDRDAEGKIKGHYARRQDWHKDEDSVLEEAPELQTFNAAQIAQMESSKKAAADKEALIGKLSGDVATLTTQLAAANTKLLELDQLKADVAALKDAKAEPTK